MRIHPHYLQMESESVSIMSEDARSLVEKSVGCSIYAVKCLKLRMNFWSIDVAIVCFHRMSFIKTELFRRPTRLSSLPTTTTVPHCLLDLTFADFNLSPKRNEKFWLLRTWLGLAPVNKLVSLTWFLASAEVFSEIYTTLHCITIFVHLCCFVILKHVFKDFGYFVN